MIIGSNDRCLATLLAALRHWQRELPTNKTLLDFAEHFDDRCTPLTVVEIDALCVRINFGDHA